MNSGCTDLGLKLVKCCVRVVNQLPIWIWVNDVGECLGDGVKFVLFSLPMYAGSSITVYYQRTEISCSCLNVSAVVG